MAALTALNTICRFVRPRDHKRSPLMPNMTIASAKLSVSKIHRPFMVISIVRTVIRIVLNRNYICTLMGPKPQITAPVLGT